MRRREAIAGAASLGILGTGGVIATHGMPSLDPEDEPSDSANGGSRDSLPAQLEEPVTIETLDLPWSDGEPITVPIAGSVTVLEFFATWCPICARNLSEVTAAHDRVGSNVRFLSITSESVGPDGQVTTTKVEEWWAEHGGGEWPIGFDPTVTLPIRLDVPGTPATAIVDAEGVTQWTHQGAVSTEKLLAEIEAAGGQVREDDG